VRIFFPLVSLFLLLPAQAQKTTSEAAPSLNPPRRLAAARRIVSRVPVFGSVGRSFCDKSGNMYMNAGTVLGDHGPYLKISSDGQNHVTFRVPNDVAKEPGNDFMSVTPDGTFYVLHSLYSENSLVKYHGDGSVDSISKLDLPPHVYLRSFAVNNNGILYVAGYKVPSPDKKEPDKVPGYAALFDNSGKLIRDLTTDSPEYNLKAEHERPVGGDLVAGDNGKFYLLSETEATIINSSGIIENSWKLPTPPNHGLALRIDEAAGKVSVITYETLKVQGYLWPTAFHFDAQTGELLHTYTFDPELSGYIECYNSEDGYMMGNAENGMMAWDIIPVH